MAGEPCDVCGQEPGQFALTDRDTGLTQFIGGNCLALLGFTMQMQADQDVVDRLLKDAGYVVTKAEKERRKTALTPEFDAGRTIAEVVESSPRDDGDEPAEDDDDMGGIDKGRHDAATMSTAPDVIDVPTGQPGDLSTPESAGATDPDAPPF